ncbi:hypothetical protein JKP88DRAFT_222337 [Tribonema minus]|uniref:Uncharacterized protein n=1 Tax=Tribonema minus TaxID=303371 RepID=A0A835YWQ6_9STRA|nr:hypothetical protein JKP88DRAFT_222337 [Tribonema minus]
MGSGDQQRSTSGSAQQATLSSVRTADRGGLNPGDLESLQDGVFPSASGSAQQQQGGTLKILGNDQLHQGNPESMVGFWQLYADCDAARVDPADRLVLRPDGQVVGGPVVNPTAVTSWSDPAGVRACGGRWAVYEDTAEGKAGISRLRMTLFANPQRTAALVLDGIILCASEYDRNKGGMVDVPRVLGDVSQRAIRDGRQQHRQSGEFSMLKVTTDHVKLKAEVGNQGPQRLW